MGWIVAVLSIFISTAALAQPALPATPSGKVLAELLDALNTGDPAKAEAFDRAYQPKDPIAGMGVLREQTGGFELVKVEQSDATPPLSPSSGKKLAIVSRGWSWP